MGADVPAEVEEMARVVRLADDCTTFLTSRSGWTQVLPDHEFWPYARSQLAAWRLGDKPTLY
jgi:hypothetical protein